MAHDPLHVLVPQRPSPPALETYQVTAAFYREVEYRQDFEAYCDWYAQAAQTHQRELAQMKREANLFTWFGLWRR